MLVHNSGQLEGHSSLALWLLVLARSTFEVGLAAEASFEVLASFGEGRRRRRLVAVGPVRVRKWQVEKLEKTEAQS